MDKKTVVSVNDLRLSLKEVLGLMLLLDDFELRDTLKYYFGILQFAASRKVNPDQHNIQQALNDVRHSLGMERASNFEEWCNKNSISKDTLKIVSNINACLPLIKASFQIEELKEEFEEFQKEETLYTLFSLNIPEETKAFEIHSDIQKKTISFPEALQKYGDDEDLSRGGFMGEIPRIELPEKFEKQLLSASTGDVLSPILDHEEWTILYLHKIIVPNFGDSEKQLRDRLFDKHIEYHADRVVVQKDF